MTDRLGDRHRPLRDEVADALRAMILSGELAPGDRLQEVRLAERLGVSRNPVREAIRSLEAVGLVEVTPRAGARVAALDGDDLLDLLELRAVLESWAAERAASHRGPGDLERIDELIATGRAASAKDDEIRAAECHRDLHLAVEHAAGNRHLSRIVEPIRSRTEAVFSVLAPHRGGDGWAEHAAIRDAIADQRPDDARRLAAAHLRRVMTAVVELRES